MYLNIRRRFIFNNVFLLVNNNFLNFLKELQKVMDDIVKSWLPILIGVCVAMISCLILIMMMRWLAGPLLWLSVIGVMLMLGLGKMLMQSIIKTFYTN